MFASQKGVLIHDLPTIMENYATRTAHCLASLSVENYTMTIAQITDLKVACVKLGI